MWGGIEASATPSHRSRSTSSTHCRALTVNLMELLECGSYGGRGGTSEWADVGRRGTAAYVAFDPKQLWQAAAPADGLLPVSTASVADAGGVIDVNNNNNNNNRNSGASSRSVLIVFSVGSLSAEELLSPSPTGPSSDGSVMQFLISRTDFIDHLLSSSASLPSITRDGKEYTMKNKETYEKTVEESLTVKEDVYEEVLLFTDVNIEGPDAFRAISVVYVHLTKGECRVTDKMAAQRRVSQVINAIQTLFLSSSETMYWVDFTGVLDLSRTEVPKELREAWWDLVVTSASGSVNDSTLRLTALVNPAVMPQLRKEFGPLEESMAPQGCTHSTNGNDTLSPKLCAETPLKRSCTEENADISSLGDMDYSNAKKYDCIAENELIWTKYANTLTSHDTENHHETLAIGEALVADNHDGVDSYDDECELIWERHLRVPPGNGNNKDVKISFLPLPLPSSSLAAASATGVEDTIVKVEEENDENELILKKYIGNLYKDVEEAPLHEVSRGLSSLFVECSSEIMMSSSLGADESIGELLVSWSALGIQHPPRIIVLIADDDYCFENALLSWVRTPCCRNALILPIFAVSGLVTHSSVENIGSELLPSIPTSHQKPSTCHEFLQVLTFAVECFGIDVHSSACLTVNHSFMQVVDQLGFKAVGDYQYISSWVTRMNGKKAIELSRIQNMLDVEAARECAFVELCNMNPLAQLLHDIPRRPEVLMQRVNNMRVGIARPVVCDSVALVSTVLTETHVSRSPNVISLPLTEAQLSSVYRFMILFFTREVFAISVDIVRSQKEDYFSGHHFATVGYFRYELTSWVRRHVLVALHVDFQPFLVADHTTPPPHWSRVIRHMSCTCTPRRHEKVLCTETGEKKCRHIAQLLYWFLRTCATPTALTLPSTDSLLGRPTMRQQRRLRGSRSAPLTNSTVGQQKEEEEEDEEEEEVVETVNSTMTRKKHKKSRMDRGYFSSSPLQIVDARGVKNGGQAVKGKVQLLNGDDVSLLEFAALLCIT